MSELDFSGKAAITYDDVLVPALFAPWAEALAEAHGPWTGRHVLDVATGTGIVAQTIGARVGAGGRVTAVDINPDMLGRARARCAGFDHVSFHEGSADAIALDAASVDTVVCQQGFQFFPEPDAAAAEMARVLRPRGNAIVSCWASLAECAAFGAIFDTLVDLGHRAIANPMHLAFSQDGDALRGHFERAGFAGVSLESHTRLLDFGSLDAAVDAAYATPIGGQLAALDADVQTELRARLRERLAGVSPDGQAAGPMVSHVVVAQR